MGDEITNDQSSTLTPSLHHSLTPHTPHTPLFHRIDAPEPVKSKIKMVLNHRVGSLHYLLWLGLKHKQGVNHISANISHHIQEEFITFALILN